MSEYVRESARLTTNYISTRSLAVVVRDKAGNTATGTSICIQVGVHHLLATAGHVIGDLNDERIELIPAGELSMERVPFVARSCSPSRSAPAADVAWIQLDSAVARSNRLRFLELNNLQPHQEFDSKRAFLVHGYPNQVAVLIPSSTDLESTVAFTMMAEPSDLAWPLKSNEVALEYPPRDANERPIAVAPRAHGLSGGGVWWHPRHDEVLVFSPERLKLVAVTTKWDQRASILVATKMEEWLMLVAQDFPDTKNEIHDLLHQ